MRRTTLTKLLPLAALVAALAAVIAGCGGSSSSGNKLSLVAYSTPKEAYAALIPAFQKTPQGKGVTFSTSYGASGDQGVVTDSVVVLVTRKGNPKHITKWEDLTKPGVQVITPNPFTSGGARWNVMAAYGSQIAQGKTDAQATAFLGELFKNVAVQDKSARDALATFTGGKGDVMIAYENEAIAAQQAGQKVDYTIPPQTILIENPVAVTKHASSKAKDFVKFLYSSQAQGIFAQKGYRPVVKGTPGADKFPVPKTEFTIQKFGGWSTVSKKFFDPDNSIMATIEKGLGVSTAK
jgi:ABC-type sulfate transport system substrate-binding protein